MYADLHLHSSFSDGTDTPEELCCLAKANHIKIISITDHDSVDGVKALQDTCNAKFIDVIPGIEISTIFNRRYLHILGYFINVNDDNLSEYIKIVSKDKTENTRINFENAKSQGCFLYPWERVLEINQNQPRISGVHVVKAMEFDHYSPVDMDLWPMFHKYFWAESSDFIETEKMTAYDAIDVIQKAGGIPVIAHPKSIGDDNIIFDLIKYGIKGLEVFHPIHTQIEIKKYLQIAAEKSLLISGGSDWHGKNNGAEVTSIGMTGLDHDGYEILKQFKERYI